MAPERVIATHERLSAIVGPGPRPTELEAGLRLERTVEEHRDHGRGLLVVYVNGPRADAPILVGGMHGSELRRARRRGRELAAAFGWQR